MFFCTGTLDVVGQVASIVAPERNLIELLQDGFVEAFADAVGLGMAHLGHGMLDVI